MELKFWNVKYVKNLFQIPLCKKSQDNPEDVITLSDGADDGDVCDDDQLVLSDEYDDEDVHPTTSCSSAITPSVRRELSPNACNSRVVNLLESYVEAGYIGSYAGSANELDAEFNGYFKVIVLLNRLIYLKFCFSPNSLVNYFL